MMEWSAADENPRTEFHSGRWYWGAREWRNLAALVGRDVQVWGVGDADAAGAAVVAAQGSAREACP